MIATIFLAVGGAASMLAMGFLFHWFADEVNWAGWVSTGCAAVAVACFIVGARLIG